VDTSVEWTTLAAAKILIEICWDTTVHYCPVVDIRLDGGEGVYELADARNVHRGQHYWTMLDIGGH